ncbi:hypothetical protein DPMN_153710 [Dreissena polymorpha]|uniref:Uncharacterized protein n=1 Tax=Dreissena polymorpha TaxID=45954 RepID=A0A9D4FPD9_DREPO|nr:hypothetical protein DPMN_153710 [Dreissena polymorpha]
MKIGHEIFKLDRGIIGTNLLTKFHEDQTRNVAYRVFTNQIRTDDGQRPVTKAHLSNQAQNIVGTNLLTKFHEHRKINVASRVLTRQNAPPLGSHFFKQTLLFSNSFKISLRPIF